MDRPNQLNAALLPFDILTSIFGYLDKKNKGRVALVCSTWNKAANQKFLWKNVEVNLSLWDSYANHSIVIRGINQYYLFDFNPVLYFSFVKSVPIVKSLRLQDECINDFLPFLFANLPILKRLNLSGCHKVSDNVLEMIISHLPAIENLDLSDCINITNVGMRVLSTGLENLRVLHLNANYSNRWTYISDDKANILTGSRSMDNTRLESLEYLYLSGNWQLTTAALKCIGTRLANLVSLDLSKCLCITDTGLECLIRLGKLTSLNLAFCRKITNAGLENITQISSLIYLDLTSCNQITDSGFKHVSGLIKLKYLNVTFCTQITDNTFKKLSQMTSLQTLKFQGCAITDMGLLYLGNGCLKLKELDLSYCPIGDKGLIYLCHSSFIYTLAILNIDYCLITRKGIRLIKEKFLNIPKNFQGKNLFI